MTHRPILFLSHSDVQELLDPRVVAQLAEQALLASASGRIALPSPDMLELAAPQVGTRYVMKAAGLLDRGITGFRITSLTGEAEEPGTPSRFVMLHDVLTGHFLALIDEEWSYALRMGAGAVVAAKYLARKDARVVTVVGSSDIARGAVSALAELLPVGEVRVTGAPPDSVDRFTNDLAAAYGLGLHPVHDLEAAVRGADILIVTQRRPQDDPVRVEWLSPGTLVCAIGAGPDLEPAIYRVASRVVIDDWSQAQRKDAAARALVAARGRENASCHDLVDVIAGRCGRMSADETVLVRSYGLVGQDVAICHWLYEEALMRGVGTPLPSRPVVSGTDIG